MLLTFVKLLLVPVDFLHSKTAFWAFFVPSDGLYCETVEATKPILLSLAYHFCATSFCSVISMTVCSKDPAAVMFAGPLQSACLCRHNVASTLLCY